MIGRAILLLVLFELVVCGTVVAVIVFGPPAAVGVPLIMVVSLLGSLALLSGLLRIMWSPMFRDHPWREPGPDAVRRRFQSFRFGLLNMGFAIHVTVDEDCLHLEPLSWLRRLGAERTSIPWSDVQPVGDSGRRVRIGSVTVDGPKWCLELAQRPPEP